MGRLDRIEKLMEELTISQKKTDEQILEVKESQKRTDEQLQRTDIRLNNVTKKMEGFLGNYGKATEELFFRSLENKMELGNIIFDRIERRVRISDNHVEFDIVLFNGECVGIVEVKSKARPQNIKEIISKKIQHFKIDYPKFSNLKVYFGIASMITNQELIDQSKKEGIFLLTQNGDHLEVLNKEVRAY